MFKVPTSRPPKSPKSPKSVNFTPLGVPAKGTEDVQQLTSSDGDDVKGMTSNVLQSQVWLFISFN